MWTLVHWLHVVAMAFFVGGQLFLAAVVVPSLRAVEARPALRTIARRFGAGTLVAIGVLIATGAAMASHFEVYDQAVSPKSKRELARQHLETARTDLDGERHGNALNAMFHAAEAAVVWLADHHGIETRRRHWEKANRRGRRGGPMSATIIRPARPRLDAWKTDRAWRARIEQDLARAEGYQTTAQTGSTARRHRTAISDLDYHVIGPRPRSGDLADEIDIVAIDAIAFCRKLRAGDDDAQWTLRYGCILFDRTGIFRSGLRLLDEERLWPDTSRKHARLPAHKLHADRLISLGDRDAAQEQVRAALTSAARATLLDAHIFPLSRDELPQQLRDLGRTTLADALESSIHAVLSLPQLVRRLSAIDEVISGGGEVVVHARNGRIRNRDTIGRPAY